MLMQCVSNSMSVVSVTIGLWNGWRVPLIQRSADLSKANDSLVLIHEDTTEYVSFRLSEIIEATCLKNIRHSGAIPPEQLNTSGVNVAFSICMTRSLYDLFFSVSFDL